jgi:hypothetical protein|eukprot:TRINITY_DN69727_c0_g1_i1.p1 TRINITY_DN69727_c0_g1~~TRINITY_DN69727_c0_g1_i1.p1  ORF type:complete len:253 (+),score=72.85 TRINITY_DN69727_c0_g1_i1:15-773(+)
MFRRTVTSLGLSEKRIATGAVNKMKFDAVQRQIKHVNKSMEKLMAQRSAEGVDAATATQLDAHINAHGQYLVDLDAHLGKVAKVYAETCAYLDTLASQAKVVKLADKAKSKAEKMSPLKRMCIANGITRPITPQALFVKMNAGKKLSLKEIAEKFNALPAAEKEAMRAKYNADMEKYRELVASKRRIGNGYSLFVYENAKMFKGRPFAETSRLLGAEWKKLSDDERVAFNNRAMEMNASKPNYSVSAIAKAL